MKFESRVLMGTALIFVITMLITVIYPHNEAFDIAKYICPMIATFVIGFVFGRYK